MANCDEPQDVTAAWAAYQDAIVAMVAAEQARDVRRQEFLAARQALEAAEFDLETRRAVVDARLEVYLRLRDGMPPPPE